MDLRDFIARCDEEGELKRITAEVDWDLEISHISKVNEEGGGPALLFENVKGYTTPVLTGAFGTAKRLSIAMGMTPGHSMCDLAKEWKDLTIKEVISAQEVNSGPIFENMDEGEAVNLSKFPVPRFYPLDGGRYIGTAVFLVVRDPETGEINLGTYRMQMLDDKRCGVQILPGKRGERILKKYKKLGKKMPAAAVIGCDPLLFMAGAAMQAGTSEFDICGSIRGVPSKIITSDYTGLPIPFDAEIVLEGEIDPENFQAEGPFGEYTGYYTDEIGKEIKKPCLEVKRVLHRNNPILWATSVGRPVTDVHMLLAFTRTATLWTDLERMQIPGLKSVYVPPESAGRFWAIASVEQRYAGHAAHVGNAIISTTTGSYGIKGVIVVDHDIKADDIGRVFWALSVRYDPMRSTELIKRGRSTPLDPALDPTGNKLITSRIIMDATIPYEWEEKPQEIALDEDTHAKVLSRWKEYGF
ncbi:MAG: phenylphosphate carboxylase subunit beta [Clostridia bacterium]|jgi:4-hydroxy-3-polyprenylbenzoate decarboxylase|nr:phenylphosphate carboxylase subunit beta [Clostridia bacterium]